MEPDRDVYPMPLFPRLTVSDVEASTEWYRSLGFEVVYEMPVMAHVRYRRYADVMLIAEEARPGRRDRGAGGSRGEGLTIYVTVDGESVDEVGERAAGAGATVVAEPHDTGWNTREVVVADPDGYEFAFSQQADPDATFAEVMGESEHEE